MASRMIAACDPRSPGGMMDAVIRLGGDRVWFWWRRDEAPPPRDWFEPGFQPSGAGRGRGGARLVELADGRRLWWREYVRGGWAAKLGLPFVRDRRLRAELAALVRLEAAGVPVPRAAGGRVERAERGLRLVLLTHDLGGRPLAEWLRCESLEPSVLRAAGRAVARLHAAGFRHPDLHPGNLLVAPDGTLWILDLCGGRFARSGVDRAALVRAARWIRKHLSRDPKPREALAFLQGYSPERRRRHRLFIHLRGRYRRAVVSRRLVPGPRH